MMDHIINFDWSYRESEEYFIKPEDLDNSVTERILRNKFHDPLISSDEEDDNRPAKINWDEVFKKAQENDDHMRLYVPGLYPIPRYLKLSKLTPQQHQQCLRVICSEYPHYLPLDTSSRIQKPSKVDFHVYEDLKEYYEQEQKEFIEWAKLVWASDHCRRALRPKPRVESIYEACTKIKALEIQGFTKNLRMAAQIQLEATRATAFELTYVKDLITVDINELPEVECPMDIKVRLNIMKPLSVPEPCSRHICRFILPTESKVTEQGLCGVQRELARLAGAHGARCVAGEAALRCLLRRDCSWALPLAVIDTVGAEGEPCNVIVLNDEFSLSKDPAPIRNYKAFKHMLDVALVPDSELAKLKYDNPNLRQATKDNKDTSNFQEVLDDSDSSDDDMMVIDAGDDIAISSPKKSPKKNERKSSNHSEDNTNEETNGAPQVECTCKGTLFENPPPRSFKKWRLRDRVTTNNIDVIVHCEHKLKVKGKANELVLEPILEYQLDLGGSEQSEDKIKALQLALMLRKNTVLANVRVDGLTGDIVTFETYNYGQFKQTFGNTAASVVGALHCTLTQLQGLLPGNYVLKHEPQHGGNALLFARAGAGEPLAGGAEPDEALAVKTPPKLAPVLLPIHRYRNILPLAFTPHQGQVAREPKKVVARQKTPPRALQWPKKRGRKKKKRQ
ncbi:uncharacterized protein [Epargyreus clarus]|uniref:uncharacterized protein isoform X2 n=1 Tax=Epargyreus clarus TaxID=520877 RepID=UPI003C2B4B02